VDYCTLPETDGITAKGAVFVAKMSGKQQRFVDEYLIDLNGTQAAIRAGYSPHTANEQASRLLTNVNISGAIDRAKADRSKRTGINADRILEELAKIAFANVADLIEFLNGGSGDRQDTAAVQSIKVKRIPTDDGDIVEREIRLNDKQKALELLGKHVDLFTDKLKLEGDFGVVITGKDSIE
jgi:phage terminase small subunit